MTPTFRLFVSSTFGDMKAEREILQARVFPKLRDYCKSKGAMFQAVDLRWGISEEAGLDQQTMNICLRELKRCQETTDKPNFLVLLGDRYGWLPLPPQIDAEEFEELERVLTTESTESTERLKRWYRRDDNAVPAQYVLLPREGEFEEFAAWNAEERSLRAILLRAVALAGWPATDPRRAKYEHSATHQEIDAGALALPDPEDRVLACFRTIKNLSEASDTFSDQDPDGTRDEKARHQLNDLRTALEYRVPKSHRYSYEAESLCAAAPLRENLHFDHDAFAAWVEESLRKIIDREIEEKQAKAADPLDQENAEHEAFGRERAHRFVGRKDLLDQIGDYMRSTDSGQMPFVVHGVSGTGKTALMGKAVLSQRHASDQSTIHNPQSTIFLERYIGATPGSSNLRSLLVDLCQQLHRALDCEALKAAELEGLGGASGEEAQKQREAIERKYGIPDDLNKLIEHFRGLPARVPDDRRLVLVLDALDQLDDEGNPHTLSWLPERLPGNVRVVVSVLDRPGEPPGRATESARRRFPDAHHEVTPLATGDAGDLLDGWLADAGRALQPEQRQSVLRGFADCGLPLWLKLVSEEARTWHAWQEPEALPVTIPALLDHFLGELEEPGRHGHELVATALGYLAAARNGLADEELLDVVALDETYWKHFTDKARKEHQIPERRLPPVLWARLHGDLAFALAQRHADNATLHTFYHRQIAEAAGRRYLDPRSRELHSRLGHYFNAQPHYHEGKPNLRKLSELVPQWIGGERWDDLIGDEEKIRPLTDLRFIQAKCEAGLVHDLVTDYNNALAALPEFAEENERLAKRDATMIAYNKALNRYAVVRYDWFQAKERGETRPEPPYPPLPAELRDESTHGIPEETSPRAARLRHFENFVNNRLAPLASNPEETLPIAFNYAQDGPVAKDSEKWIEDHRQPWLRRSPRPPAQPSRPQCLRKLEGHGHWVNNVIVTPDGRQAVSGSSDKTVRVWDLGSGACLRTLEGHSARVNSVSVTPDGRKAASGSDDKMVRVWDLGSGACLHILEGHSDRVSSVSVTTDGRKAASGSDDNTVRVWDLESGACLRTLEGHCDQVWSVSVTPDGRRAVSGSCDNTVRVWDLESGACLRTLEGHCVMVMSVSVTPDGRRAVSGSGDNTVRVWDLESGACLRTLEGHCDQVWSVSVTPDGRRAVSGSWDKTVRVWNLGRRTCLRMLECHGFEVLSVSVTPDGRRAVSGSGDNTVRVWNLESGECPRTMEGYGSEIRLVTVTPDGRQAVAGDWKTLRVWDIASGACLRNLEGHGDLGWSVSVTPDGRRAVSGSGDNTVRVWDLEGGKCLRTLKGHADLVSCVSVSPDGRWAVSGSYDKTVRVWDLAGGACLQTMEGHTCGVESVSVTPDGRCAVSGSIDGKLRVWNLAGGACLRTMEGHTRGVRSVSVSPDGRRAVSGSYDKTLRVWDLETGQCLRNLEGHSSWVLGVSWSPDGRRAISASADKTLQVWDLETGQCLAVYHAGAAVSSVVISPSSNHIVCGSQDGQMHFLTHVNFPPPDPPLVTAVRLWRFGDGDTPGRWDDDLTVLCPHCVRRFPAGHDMLGQLINCPHCGRPLKFNPFVVDRG